MPLPPSGDVAVFKAAMRDVNTLARRDLRDVWSGLNVADAAQVSDAVVTVLPALVNQWAVVSATVAADWYDVQRANASVRRRFDAVPADPPDINQSEALARWGVGPLFSGDPDAEYGGIRGAAAAVALTKLEGSLQRLVSDGGRDTIVESARRDPERVGWARVGEGDCDFCTDLIALGPVYSQEYASFPCHDRCKCDAVPVFG